MKRPAWTGIVKVQRSLFSSTGGTRVSINSEDRSIYHEGPIDDEIGAWFKKDEYKVFAVAELRGTIVHLIRKAPWQEW